MGGELLSGGMRALMEGYTPFWRRWRKLLHGGFMQRQSDKYRPTQSLESKVLLHELLHEPDEFRTHLQRYTASVIVTVTYGRRVEDVRTDIVVQRNNESVDRFVSVNIPGKFAVERYPILKYIPAFLAPWKADVLRQRQKDIQLYTQLLDEVKEKVARGVAHDCWTTQLLAQQEELQMKDIEIAYTAGGSFAAGVETVCICSYHNPPGIHPTHVRHLVCKHSLKLFLGFGGGRRWQEISCCKGKCMFGKSR